MLKKYLEKISEVKIELIETKLVDWKILNLVIFWNKIQDDLVKYKIVFLKRMLEKTDKLLKIIEEINNSSIISFNKGDEQILKKEIFVKLKKIEFLKKVYDVEANKLDKNYKIKEEIEEKIEDFSWYDYYNNIFYQFTKKNLEEEIIISENKNQEYFISKEKLVKLLEFSKKLIPELKWNFWNFAWLQHDNWVLNIPSEREYNIKRIIAIFFHEMTHFFRYLNWKNNLWFDYKFEDYDSLEEGITTYNEYYYWNKIIDYWKYNAYYDKCYQILLEDVSEKEKKEKIFQILKNKWFDRKKTDLLYTRFYRYSKIWWKKLFLKELIYNNAYKNVIKLINEGENNYKKIMSWNIWLYELENNLIKSDKNFDSKKYFNIMVEEIKKIIK